MKIPAFVSALVLFSTTVWCQTNPTKASITVLDQWIDSASGFTCMDLSIPLHVNRTLQKQYTLANYDINALWAMKDFETFVTKSYTTSGVYCAPPVNKTGFAGKDKNVVQLLSHGATFNKWMWNMTHQPEKYSWTRRMNLEGYATLAIDLLGSGDSDHPDGLFEVQTQTVVDQMHQAVQHLRSGAIGGRPKRKIAVVGFSISAIGAVSLLHDVPDAFDALILHGFTWSRQDMYPAFLAGLQVTANSLNVSRWAKLSNLYSTHPTLDTRRAAAFFGDYDEEALKTEFVHRDCDTLGLAMSFSYHVVDAQEFKGPVFIANGDQDGTFCGRRCGSQPYRIYDHIPKASDYDVKVYPQTGHAIIFHNSTIQLMDDTLQFLKRNHL